MTFETALRLKYRSSARSFRSLSCRMRAVQTFECVCTLLWPVECNQTLTHTDRHSSDSYVQLSVCVCMFVFVTETIYIHFRRHRQTQCTLVSRATNNYRSHTRTEQYTTACAGLCAALACSIPKRTRIFRLSVLPQHAGKQSAQVQLHAQSTTAATRHKFVTNRRALLHSNTHTQHDSRAHTERASGSALCARVAYFFPLPLLPLPLSAAESV